jgi:hypothetical protein
MKKKKNSFTPPPTNLKGKKARHLECMLGPSLRLQKISLPKRVCHHFWPGLYTLCKEHPTYFGNAFGIGFLPYTNNYENSRKKTHESSESPNYGGFLFVHF